MLEVLLAFAILAIIVRASDKNRASEPPLTFGLPSPETRAKLEALVAEETARRRAMKKEAK